MKCHQENKEREQAEQGQHEVNVGTAACSVSTSHPALQDRQIKPQEWKNSDCTGILCSGTSKLPGTQLCSADTLFPPCLVRGISPGCALWAGSRDKLGTSCSLPCAIPQTSAAFWTHSSIMTLGSSPAARTDGHSGSAC